MKIPPIAVVWLTGWIVSMIGWAVTLVMLVRCG